MVEEIKHSPIEELMVEHSILRRALLIYEECIRRMNNFEEFDPDLLVETTNVLKVLIVYHHSLLEQEYIFPRFRQANKYVELCDILEDQHEYSGKQEEIILKYSNKESINNIEHKNILINSLKKIIKVMRPHVNQEDTELFPEFKNIVSPEEFYALGQKFEDIEFQKWGEHGEKKMLDKIVNVEKELGIYDLDAFTPKP